MAGPAPPSLVDSIAAAQAWWREAGVDLAFNDEPTGWLEAPADTVPAVAEPKAPARPAPPAIGGDPAAWPDALTEFRRWWLEEPSLDSGGTHPRVAPRGEPGADLMMLVPMPEAGDGERLLDGPQGRLLASLAHALGLKPEQVYLAAALPRHTALPDWPRLAAEGLAGVIQHHIAVARPKRVMAFGTDILPLLGHDPAQGTPPPTQIAIQGAERPLLAAFAPGRLLENARLREGLWQRVLEWTDGETL